MYVCSIEAVGYVHLRRGRWNKEYSNLNALKNAVIVNGLYSHVSVT